MSDKTAKRKTKRARDKANVNYFITLANTRGSLENLPIMALLSVIFLSLDTLAVFTTAIVEGHRELMPLFSTQLALIGFSALMLVVAPIKALVFRFQTFFSALMAVFAVIWVYMLTFLAMVMVIQVRLPMSTILNLELLPFFAIGGPLYVAGALGVHVLMLKKRLRDGHSEERTHGNVVAASSAYSSKSVWIIAAVTLIVPNVLTQGQYFLQIFGLAGFLFLASVMPGLVVEFTYLAYLKSQDRKYWVRRPPKRVYTRQEIIAALKKVRKWIVIGLTVFAVIQMLTFK